MGKGNRRSKGRNSPIRVTQNDREEYAKLVRNAKSKIKRTFKNYGINLANEIEIPSLSDIKSRDKFNRVKEQLQSFTKRANLNYQFEKNKYGVVATKKEINEIKRNTKKAQRIADSFIGQAENKPFISGGKVQGTVGQQMKQMARPNAGGIHRPKDFNFDSIQTQKQLEKRKESINKKADIRYYDKRMEQMKTNFIDILRESFHTSADRLIEELKEIPADDFYEMYLMFDEFDFSLFDSDGQIVLADEGHIGRMLTYVERYKRNELNFDLKEF